MPVAKKVKVCPEGKELKPSTGRCVKKCKPNRLRDPDTFKCIKNPKNHIINPITGRQVKRGYYHGIEKAQARILQAIVRRKIAKGKPSAGTPEQYKRMSPAARSSTSSSASRSSSSSSSSAVFNPHKPFISPKPKKSSSASAASKSNSSSLLGSPARSSRASLSSSHSSHSSRSSRSSKASAASAASHSVSSPKHVFKFMDGKRKGDVVKIRKYDY